MSEAWKSRQDIHEEVDWKLTNSRQALGVGDRIRNSPLDVQLHNVVDNLTLLNKTLLPVVDPREATRGEREALTTAEMVLESQFFKVRGGLYILT